MDHEKALWLAEEYVGLDRGERALEVLQHASQTEPLTWLWRSNALYALGRYAEASEAARTGLKIDAESSYLFHALARAESALGNAPAAQAAIEESLRLNPDSASALAQHAAILARRKKKDAATKVLARAAELAPEDRSVRILQAMVTPHDPEAIFRMSRELLEQYPDGALEHWWHGHVLLRRFRMRRAADHFARAVALEPQNQAYARVARVARHWFFWPLRITSPALTVIATSAWLVLLLFRLWPAFWATTAWIAYWIGYLMAIGYAERKR